MRKLSLVPIALFVSLIVACGSSGSGGGKDDGGPGGPCTAGTDLDGDGFGEGCPAGPDCNDLDPSVAADCPDANCGAGVFAGCACDPVGDAPVTCYEASAGTEGVGVCVKGTRACDPSTATWGVCAEQVVPSREVCDEVNNDCDGEVDEGVTSACGNCVPGCDESGVGDDPFPFPGDDPNVEVNGVGLDPNGDLVLDGSTVESHFLWIANDQEGTVSKIDTRTGQEVARYASVSREVIVDATGGAGGPVAAWDEDTNGNNVADNRPSRTAVDSRGDVWVANRAHDFGGLQPSATKIRNVEADCVDRNGNRSIDTSREVNGTPGIQLDDPAEFLAEADECIAFTVKVGAVGGNARAIAVGKAIDPGTPGNAWVGMHNEKAFYELDGRTGALRQRAPETGALAVSPYGAAIDGLGRLWAPNGCCGRATLVAIDTNTLPAVIADPVVIPTLGSEGSYGIVVDLENRVWVGGWPNRMLKRYDPATGETVQVELSGFPTDDYGVRGVGIDSHGNVWAAVHRSNFSDGWVARVDAAAASQTLAVDMGGETPVGVGIDFDGDVWTVNQDSSSASRLHIDQTTLEPAAHPTTSNQVDEFSTGRKPYTYSDFTGLSRRIVTDPLGDYRTVLQGCSDGGLATWLSVTWDATTPANTSVEIYVRAGNDLATIGSEPQFGPWTVSPADLQVPPGPVPDARYLELTIRLLSNDRVRTPIVHAYEVNWACVGDPIP